MAQVRRREIQPIATDVEWRDWIAETRMALQQRQRDVLAGVHASISQMKAEISTQSLRRVQADNVADQQHHLAVLRSFDDRLVKLHHRLADLIGLSREGREPQNRERAVLELGALAIDLDHAAKAAFARVMIGSTVWVIRNMRFPRHGFPAGYRSSMPEPVHDWQAYSAQEAPLITRQQPNARQISAADRVLPWFFFVADCDDRSALWLRHIPLSWRKVGSILDRSHTWAVLAEGRAIDQIVRRIGGDLSTPEF